MPAIWPENFGSLDNNNVRRDQTVAEFSVRECCVYVFAESHDPAGGANTRVFRSPKKREQSAQISLKMSFNFNVFKVRLH